MKEHIKDLECEVKGIEHLREEIFEATKTWHETCKGNIDIHEFGDHVDVIKDLAEAEKELWEAAYFKSICCAMLKAEEEEKESEEWMSRDGYNHNHYKSGRFASSGHGHWVGYPHLPHVYRGEHMMPQMHGYPVYYDEGEHAGHGDVMTGYGENGAPQYAMDEDSMEHGRAYGRYRAARRHYTETHDASDKHDMTKHGMDHFGKTLKTITTIWEDVDPEMRKKMRTDLEKLIGQMPV